MNPVSMRSSMVQNRPAMPASRVTMSGNLPSARPVFRVLVPCTIACEPQHALALGAALQRQQPEMDLEQRQVRAPEAKIRFRLYSA
jgi:hypothetical protein